MAVACGCADTNALLGQYQYAVTRVQGTSSKGMAAGRVSDTARKLRHLWTSVASDFAGSSLLSFEFFVQLVLLLVALWLRIYAHYIGTRRLRWQDVCPMWQRCGCR